MESMISPGVPDSNVVEDPASAEQPVAVTSDMVFSVLEADPQLESFNDIQSALSKHVARRLTTKERKIIASCMNKRAIFHAQCKNDATNASSSRVLMITAYSDDYAIGAICEAINRRYAERHGYRFESEVIPYPHMLEAISPRAHCAWYKALMLLRYLENKQELLHSGIDYLLWIDADAIVIDHSISLDYFITLGRGSDLIISEDIHKGCLINSGVMLVRLTEWSRSLWDEVWNSERSRRYHDVYFYDQSALMRALRARDVGLEQLKPFHSFDTDGPQGPKFFRHVCVLTHLQFNTNAGVSVHRDSKVVDDGNAAEECIAGGDHGGSRALFVFHALGPWNKMDALVKAVQLYRVHRYLGDKDKDDQGGEYDAIGDSEGGYRCDAESVLGALGVTATQVAAFRLRRGRCGAAPAL